MTTPKTPIAMAARHVAEAEMRVLRQATLPGDLASKEQNTGEAEKLLRLLRAALDACQDRLRLEQDKHDA